MSDQNEKYKVKWTTKFKKDYKQAKKRGCDIDLLKKVVHLIAKGDQQQKLVDEYDDHPLSGNWKDHRELHLEPDWILVYHIDEDVLVLSLVRNGTHSDIFNK